MVAKFGGLGTLFGALGAKFEVPGAKSGTLGAKLRVIKANFARSVSQAGGGSGREVRGSGS